MGRPLAASSFTANVTVVTTAETVIATLPGIFLQSRDERVRVEADAVVTTGVGTTGYTLRIRRGTTVAGTLVGEANVQQVQAVAGSTEAVHIAETDAPGVELAGESYVLTYEAVAATGNGTALEGSMSAETV